MATFSFDIVSDYDKAELNNVFDQSQREMDNRYDFKGTPAAIEWLDDKSGLKITGNGDWQIDAILDIVRKKLAAREQPSGGRVAATDFNFKGYGAVPSFFRSTQSTR